MKESSTTETYMSVTIVDPGDNLLEEVSGFIRLQLKEDTVFLPSALKSYPTMLHNVLKKLSARYVLHYHEYLRRS